MLQMYTLMINDENQQMVYIRFELESSFRNDFDDYPYLLFSDLDETH